MLLYGPNQIGQFFVEPFQADEQQALTETRELLPDNPVKEITDHM